MKTHVRFIYTDTTVGVHILIRCNISALAKIRHDVVCCEHKILLKREVFEMKSTGIVRQVDQLGRIVLPIELRRTLDIAERDSLEIFTEDDKIILRKYTPGCIFCGETDAAPFKGQLICAACRKELTKL